MTQINANFLVANPQAIKDFIKGGTADIEGCKAFHHIDDARNYIKGSDLVIYYSQEIINAINEIEKQ